MAVAGGVSGLRGGRGLDRGAAVTVNATLPEVLEVNSAALVGVNTAWYG